MKIRSILALSVAALLACQGRLSADLIFNGGFETGDFTGWTQGGPDQGDNGVQGAPYNHSGNFGAALAATSELGDTTVAQSFATTVASQYLVSYWLYVGPGSDGGSDFSATFGSTTLQSLINPVGAAYQHESFTATATTTTTTLTFASNNGPSTFGLDDVSVTLDVPPPPSGAPEPSAVVALFGLGAMGLFLVARRKFAA